MSKKLLAICLVIVAAVNVLGQSRSKPAKQQRPVKQTREVIEAYRVCAEFQRLFGDEFDFDRAFEATFTKDPARRRAIAIAEGEFGDLDVSQVDDETLISIYKNQVQLFYLILFLIEPEGQVDKAVLFPPPIEAMVDRVRARPKNVAELIEWAAQLQSDVIELRAHWKQLAAKYPFLAERFRGLKGLWKGPEIPTTYVVKPLTSYRNSNVLRANEEYYDIDNYSVIREGSEMKIIGIRFFTRLF